MHKWINSKPVFFNRFGGAKLQGCIPVARGTPVHASAQKSLKILSFVAFAELLAEPLECAGGSLGSWGTPAENHCSKRSNVNVALVDERIAPTV